jgi:hypothetical protein
MPNPHFRSYRLFAAKVQTVVVEIEDVVGSGTACNLETEDAAAVESGVVHIPAPERYSEKPTVHTLAVEKVAAWS